MTTHPGPAPDHHAHGEHRAHAEHHGHGHDDSGALADVLDLDAEVLADHLAAVTGWVADTVPAPARIVDLGAGTGTGTLALLERFPTARVVAVDVAAPLLDRLRGRVGGLGLGDRVDVVRADLDAGWPDLTAEGFDLAWAAASLHHLADPDRVLADVRRALRPGGALVVLELEGFPRFLPDDVGHGAPGLEERVHALLARATARDLPHLGGDWGVRLRAAGFTVHAREFPVDLTGDVPPATARYAWTSLRRLRTALEDRLGAQDRATLDVLLDGDGPGAVLHRDDLTVRTRRSAWIATRP